VASGARQLLLLGLQEEPEGAGVRSLMVQKIVAVTWGHPAGLLLAEQHELGRQALRMILIMVMMMVIICK
jgi:hypothetical protein